MGNIWTNADYQAARDSTLRGEALREVLTVLYSLEAAVGELFQGDQWKKGFYSNIPWSYVRFLKSLEFVGKVRFFLSKSRSNEISSPKFIDAGCGLGVKVALAFKYGWDAYGVEINETYCNIANTLLGEHRNRIIYGDARQHDFSSYDVIYYYNPMRGGEEMDSFRKPIWENAKPGAIIISALESLPNPFCNGWQQFSSSEDTGSVYVRCSGKEMERWESYQKELTKTRGG